MSEADIDLSVIQPIATKTKSDKNNKMIGQQLSKIIQYQIMRFKAVNELLHLVASTPIMVIGKRTLKESKI